MQINRIECELGVTVNAGDFQSVKGTVKMTADLDRGEDARQAYGELAATVHASLVDGLRISHPDAMRAMIGGDTAPAQARIAAPTQTGATAAQTEEQKRKPGRPPKAATPAAKPAEAPKQADTAEGMSIGGLDGEDSLDGLDDLDALEDEKPVTRDELRNNLQSLVKRCGQPALKELLSKYNATNFSQLPEDKFAAVNKDALKAIGAAVA